ncbi:hypothetical protein BDZ97DRAFT_1597959, partial [Flammula alnicola]
RCNFLKCIAPKQTVPRCPFGNTHRPNIYMGVGKAEDLGRRFYYCDARKGLGRPCVDHKDTLTPILPEVTRNRLRHALKVFDDCRKDGLTIAAATEQGKAALGPEELRVENTVQPIKTGQSQSVDIILYLMKNDGYIKQEGQVENDAYFLLSDSSLCDLMNFPYSNWSVYDRFRKTFSAISTFGGLSIAKGEFLIFRPSAFSDEDC